jgi:hypothetical protein
MNIDTFFPGLSHAHLGRLAGNFSHPAAAAASLRSHYHRYSEAPSLPVLLNWSTAAVTASTTSHEREEAMTSGFSSVLGKPFSAQELDALILKHFTAGNE